tara:strand:- start:47 stop:460 length:414 start_codon:yes stop_codon:yes gene_type:complete
MNIINIFFIILGIITVLIGFVAYKRRYLIMEMIRAKQATKMAIKNLEREAYLKGYEKELRTQLPKAMRAKAARDIERKYNKTPIMDKLAKMATEAQKEATKRSKNPNYKSGFESVMDDMNVFNTKSKKKKSKDMWDF